jgi:cytochrome c556
MAKTTRLAMAIGFCTLISIGLTTEAQEHKGMAKELTPLVSIMELMQQTITPATNQLWSAWEEPSTPDEWRKMEEAAITLLAASSLTATGGTGPMDNQWVQEPAWQAFNTAMVGAGKAALAASRNMDQQALLDAGDLLLPPCEGCHQQFNPAVVNAQ